MVNKTNENRAKRLISKAAAAKKAGVSRAAMTKACAGPLKPALVGDQVDIDAPAFRQYVQNRQSKPTAAVHEKRKRGKRDPLYEDALGLVLLQNRASASFLQNSLSIGYARASKIIAVMEAEGVISPANDSGKRSVLIDVADVDIAAVEDSAQAAEKTQEVETMAPPAMPAPAEISPPAPDEDDFYSEVGEFVNWTLRELLNRFGSSQQFKNWLDARKSIEDIKLKELNVAEKRGELIPREFVITHIFSLFENHHTRLLSDYPKTLLRTLYPMIKAGGKKEDAEKLIVDLMSSQLKTIKDETQRKLKKV